MSFVSTSKAKENIAALAKDRDAIALFWHWQSRQPQCIDSGTQLNEQLLLLKQQGFFPKKIVSSRRCASLEPNSAHFDSVSHVRLVKSPRRSTKKLSLGAYPEVTHRDVELVQLGALYVCA